MRQAGHLRSHVVQVGLQGSTYEQGVGQVCDVDAHDGKGIAERRVTKSVGVTLKGLQQQTMLKHYTTTCFSFSWKQKLSLCLIIHTFGKELNQGVMVISVAKEMYQF